MNDILRFLALAIAVGLAAGMVLGGMALMLAAPAYATSYRAAACVPMAFDPRDRPADPSRVWVAYQQ